jgi:hypothetical protein
MTDETRKVKHELQVCIITSYFEFINFNTPCKLNMPFSLQKRFLQLDLRKYNTKKAHRELYSRLICDKSFLRNTCDNRK